MDTIKLYIGKHCGRCKMIETLLQEKSISYQSISNDEEIVNMALQHHCRELPFAVIDDQFYTHQQLLEKIKNL